MRTCSSCGRMAADATVFPCPNCEKGKIARCKSCRENANKYACRECGFEGP
ncbi:MAG TPA: zinc finger domain-containing protein [Candidatus Norongarragalinales archaeon]|nr:zinc finger domain-containing protein [Candidatus Norongarragalinales archaeon]